MRLLEEVPFVRQFLERLYKWRFARSWVGSCFGVFPNFAEADRAAPKNKPLGFNCPEYALEFENRITQIFSFDYPMLFWLTPLLKDGLRIFDFGGHVGMHFYSYAQYMTYPPRLSWLVCDLPEITKRGEELARQQNTAGLSFTNRFEDAEDADILIAAGVLQYIESPSLAELLSQLERKPRHLLINKLPLYGGEQFVTLQNGGAAFHPQYIFNRQQFIESLVAIGYSVKDMWNVDTHSGRIPFHPGRSFRCHTGLYLSLHESSPE